MTLEQIKRDAEALSFAEKGELAAFPITLRNREDPEWMGESSRRIGNTETACWLTPEQFERRLHAGRISTLPPNLVEVLALRELVRAERAQTSPCGRSSDRGICAAARGA